MSSLRALAIGTVFFALTVLSIPIQFFSIRFNLKLQKTYPHAYHGLLCRLFGIRFTVIGKPVTDRGVLMVANHSGYFDILIMSAMAHVSFVAREDVGHWPLFGLMSRLQRSVFVERKRRSQTGEARDELSRRLKQGDTLVLFPEGTSTDGNRVITFKSALMGAVETEIGKDAAGNPVYVPVQPVSIAYTGLHGMPLSRDTRPLVTWYGDMDLLDHLWEAMKAGPFDVTVQFHPPLTAGPGFGRKQIAALAETTVRRGHLRALNGQTEAAQEPTEKAA